MHGERPDPVIGDFESNHHLGVAAQIQADSGTATKQQCFCREKISKLDLCSTSLVQRDGGEATGGRILTLE